MKNRRIEGASVIVEIRDGIILALLVLLFWEMSPTFTVADFSVLLGVQIAIL